MRIVNIIAKTDVMNFNNRMVKEQVGFETHLETKKKRAWRINAVAILITVLFLWLFWMNWLPVSVFGYYLILGGWFISLMAGIQTVLARPINAKKDDKVTLVCPLQTEVDYNIELADEGISWLADDVSIEIAWEEVVRGTYLGDDVVDLWTADRGFFIKLDKLAEEERAEVVKRVRSQLGARLEDQAAAKSRHYDYLALKQRYVRPFLLINLVLLVAMGIAGTMIDKNGRELREDISKGTSMEQVKQLIGRPNGEVTGKVYFEMIIKERARDFKKRNQSEVDALKGLMDVAIVGQRELLEQETAKVLIYGYHGESYFYLFIDGKYVQSLLPLS